MKGRPLAKQGYEQELSSIRAFVSMQNKADSGSSGISSTDHGVMVCVRGVCVCVGVRACVCVVHVHVCVCVHVFTCIMLAALYYTCTSMYIHVHEQLTRQQTKQHNTTQHNDTRDNNLFSKKKLPQVGLEPTTLCSLDECSTT